MKFAVLDLETTGTQAVDDIIQIGIVLVNAELEITDSFSSFVKPEAPISAFITQLTGIEDATVADAPPLEEVLLRVIPLLEDAVLVAHNAGFDLQFLNASLDRCGYHRFDGGVLDTVELLRMLYPSLASYQLSLLSETFGITHDRHHQADSDARATAELFATAVRKLRELPLLTLQRLETIYDQPGSDMGWLLRDALARKEAEIALDTDAQHYFRGLALKVQDWTEEEPPRANLTHDPLEGMPFADYLEAVKDAFRAQVSNYEEREAQNQMFEEVYEALAAERHLLVEAGTGTGKSLGYLIPALYYGVKHERKIVISTHTINLQEQLRERDVPLLQETLPFPFRAAVFKGRSNYLCLRKFEGKINVNDFKERGEDRLNAAQMVIWLGETAHGDQEELNFGSRGQEFWSGVASDSDSCLNRACPWFKRCFYHRAKHEANLADVVITNHAMLFTDIRAEHRLLPSYEHLVVDEAHHLEEVAGKHLGMQFGYLSLPMPLQRLCKDARTGQLHQLRLRLGSCDHMKLESWLEQIDEMIGQFADVRDEWDQLFELLYASSGLQGAPEQQGEMQQLVARLRSEPQPPYWQDVLLLEERVHQTLGKLGKGLDKLLAEVKEELDEPGLQALVTDMNGSVKDMLRVREELHFFAQLSDRETVYWLEAHSNFRAKSVQAYAVPVHVSAQLQQYFFAAKKSIILTSATLSVKKSFEYVSEQLGLQQQEEQGRLKAVQLSSPFHYREQALVIIPRNFPALKGQQGEAAFVAALVESLAAAARETKGRMLVLFTSYRMLRQVYDPLKEILAAADITVIGQGIDSGNRTKLTRRFLQLGASVLLGTSSFWEGVDLPGDALVCLAIVRLPFQPPNHPLLEARSERLQEQRQNPFMKLSIPQAVIRFKQGFGRLVRRASDRGIVLIYDTRVIETYYGKHFLYSLPGPKIEHMHMEQMVPRMREWLQTPPASREEQEQTHEAR